MSKNISYLLVIILLSFSANALAKPLAIEGRAGAFIPFSNKIDKIFGTMPFVELQGNYRFSPHWNYWAGVGYIFAQGRSIGCGDRTTIGIVPFSLGLKRFFSLTKNLDGFLGFGGLWSLYYNHDHSQSVHQRISGNAFGAIANSGVQWQWRRRIFISFVCECLYQHFNFSKVYQDHFTYRHDVNMSGLKVGLGITYVY